MMTGVAGPDLLQSSSRLRLPGGIP
jgi:hypothetical protein